MSNAQISGEVPVVPVVSRRASLEALATAVAGLALAACTPGRVDTPAPSTAVQTIAPEPTGDVLAQNTPVATPDLQTSVVPEQAELDITQKLEALAGEIYAKTNHFALGNIGATAQEIDDISLPESTQVRHGQPIIDDDGLGFSMEIKARKLGDNEDDQEVVSIVDLTGFITGYTEMGFTEQELEELWFNMTNPLDRRGEEIQAAVQIMYYEKGVGINVRRTFGPEGYNSRVSNINGVTFAELKAEFDAFVQTYLAAEPDESKHQAIKDKFGIAVHLRGLDPYTFFSGATGVEEFVEEASTLTVKYKPAEE